MKKITVTLPLKKETKGAYQYQGERNDTDPVTTLYIRKSGIDGDAPKKIKIEVSSA